MKCAANNAMLMSLFSFFPSLTSASFFSATLRRRKRGKEGRKWVKRIVERRGEKRKNEKEGETISVDGGVGELLLLLQ